MASSSTGLRWRTGEAGRPGKAGNFWGAARGPGRFRPETAFASLDGTKPSRPRFPPPVCSNGQGFWVGEVQDFL